MYYLNAFNEMLRKRQRQNMMGGEGYQNDAAPSGPMGARQSGNFMTNVRDLLNNPYVGFAASATPFRAPFAAAKLGVSAYDNSRLASDQNAAMEAARQGFQASEKGLYDAPDFSPYPDSSVDPSAYEGAMPTNSFPAGSMGGTPNYSYGDVLRGVAMAAPATVVGELPDRSISATPLAPITTDVGSFYGGSDNNANTGNFGGVTGGSDTMGFGATYNQGGMVTPDRLMGRAPAPDDGYGALKRGEYVITKEAVERYGKAMMDAINNGTFR